MKVIPYTIVFFSDLASLTDSTCLIQLLYHYFGSLCSSVQLPPTPTIKTVHAILSVYGNKCCLRTCHSEVRVRFMCAVLLDSVTSFQLI